MSEKVKMKILIVDDEELSLEIMVEFLRFLDVTVITAKDGNEAFEKLESEAPDIIISDNVMPSMTGLELCRKIRLFKEYETLIFILTSAVKVSAEDAANAIEQGADDFIKKDLSKVEFLAKIRSFIRIRELQLNLHERNEELRREKEELDYSYKQISAMTRKLEESNRQLFKISEKRKRDLEKSLELLSWLIEARRQYHRGHAKEVANVAEYIAEQMELPGGLVKSIKTAAMLHEIGKIGIPDELAMKKPDDYTPDEKELLLQHPISGAKLLSEYLGESSDIVKYIKYSHERYDGSGYPENLRGREIPVGSRIIALANLFDNIVNRAESGTIERFFDILNEKAGSKYDPSLIKYIRQYIKDKGIVNHEHVKEMRLYEVEPGMEIQADIFTKSGMKLLHAGTVLDEHAISTLIRYNKIDPIEDKIYIKG
ncbi:MAG: HD domain-containing phosphohydrolase [Fidelibacterota bacterium]